MIDRIITMIIFVLVYGSAVLEMVYPITIPIGGC